MVEFKTDLGIGDDDITPPVHSLTSDIVIAAALAGFNTARTQKERAEALAMLIVGTELVDLAVEEAENN